jgi:type I restriction enzyme S subunit
MKETADIQPVSSEVATSTIQVRSKHKMPENWEMLEFGNFTELFKGKYIPVNNENLRCIELEHFEQGTGRIYGWVDSSEQKSTKNKFQKGQVLFGKLRPYLRKYWLAEFDGVCSSEVWVMNSKNKKCSNEFLFRIIQHDYFIQVANVSSGSKMPRADWDYVASFPFLLPPLPEQRAIAALLSTWDEAIQSASQLIEQKELSKKWLMQNLLTGKSSLKEFNGEWKRIGAGEIFKSLTIKGFASEELLSVTQDRGVVPRSMSVARVTMPSGETTGFKLVEAGDFVISLRSFQGGLEYSYYRGIVSPAYTVLKPRKKINDEFYKQYFKSYDFIGHLAVAVIGIRDGKQISYEDFCFVKIPYPSFEEQTAIAEVLQTADNELKLLKDKLELLKEQKRGLMQILLTGQKRLKIQ